jgi:WD40 repeat protein/serine/threonine protein kinase
MDLPADTSDAELPGIAGYETLKVLGRGGMGVVYLAWQPTLARLVALKIMLAGAHAGPQHRARFRTEAEAAARLQHSNIVQIYEVGEAAGQPYLVMEYVDGGSLAACLNGKPQPWRSACTLVAALAAAVHHAHERGIIHRDLKPENILLQKDERKTKDLGNKSSSDSSLINHPSSFTPKITDFGLAKLVIGGLTQTIDGAVLGTPGYMAPEQAGMRDAVGPAADIHALGAILYEMLTGRPPFRAAGVMETLEHLRSQEPVSPRRLVATVPKDLETICLKCLQKDPGKRYESALALAEDLRHCLAGEPVQARPLSAWERGVKWVRRHPARAALLGMSCLAALALTGVAVGLSYSARLHSLNRDLEVAVHTAEAAQDEAERRRDELDRLQRWVRYLHDVHLAEEAWQNGQFRRIPDLLAGCPPDLRGWEWYYLHGLAHNAQEPLNHPAGVHAVAFDPSGRQLASGCQDGSVWIWDIEARERRPTTELHTNSVRSVAFSADGRLLASAGDDGIVHLWDPHTGEPVRTLPGQHAPLRSVVFSSNGKIIAVAGKEGTIKLYDPDSGDELRTLTGHRGGTLTLAFALDSGLLASGGADRTVKLWNPNNGNELHVLKGHTDDVRGVAFSSDGKTLASVSGDGTLRTWDAAKGESLAVYFPPEHTALYSVAFGPAGRMVAGTENHLVYVWDGALLQPYRRHNHRVESVAVSPDGRIASASMDRTIQLWEAGSGQEYRPFPSENSRVLSARFSPDDERIFDAAFDGTVRIWDARSGRLRQQLKTDLDRPRSVAFSATGHLAAAGGKGSIRCYDLDTGTADSGTRKHGNSARAVAFSPDGLFLASTGDDGTVKVWDLVRDRLLFTRSEHTAPVYAVAFSPDGRTLVSGGRDGVRLWDATTGEPMSVSPPNIPRVTALAFDANGCLAIAQMGGNITLWNPATGEQRDPLIGHSAPVWSLAFSPDGKRLASGGRDLTVKLWDTAGGQQVLTLRGFASEISSVSFSGDGTRLITTDQSGAVRLWETERHE